MAAHVFRPDADGQFPGILLRTAVRPPQSLDSSGMCAPDTP